MRYQPLYWLVAEVVVFGGVLGAIATLYIVQCVKKRCAKRDKQNYATSPTPLLRSNDGSLEESAFSIREEETKLWRGFKLLVEYYIYLSIGFGIILTVGMDMIPWVVGVLLFTLVYAFIFAVVLKKKSHRKIIEREELLSEDDDSERAEFVIDDEFPTKSKLPRSFYYLKRWLQTYLKSLKETVLNHKLVFGVGVVVILIVGVLAAVSSDCMCVAANPIEVSSRWSRSVQKSICDGRTVCHVYVTMADSSTDLIVNFHTTQLVTGIVGYDIVSHMGEGIGEYENATYSTSFKMYNIVEEDRYVHWAELPSLEAGATYYFIIEVTDEKGVVTVTQEYKFKTIPENNDGKYNFISGGDMSADDNVVTLSKFAAGKNPYFAMVGGDVAYDNGMVNCYRRWDTWFENWYKYMTTPDGFLIPALLAVGNHEAGGFQQYGGSTPFFTAYFPQQLGLQQVDPFNRILYHTHRIGKTGFIVVLDSDVLSTMEDQVSFVDNAFSIANAENRTAKFAIYHATIYATVPAFAKAITAAGKKHWTPIFDKHNVTVVFENHLHCYKRTKPLRDDKITTVEEGGVVYLGDGSWGVDPKLIPATYSWYMEVVERKHYNKSYNKKNGQKWPLFYMNLDY